MDLLDMCNCPSSIWGPLFFITVIVLVVTAGIAYYLWTKLSEARQHLWAAGIAVPAATPGGMPGAAPHTGQATPAAQPGQMSGPAGQPGDPYAVLTQAYERGEMSYEQYVQQWNALNQQPPQDGHGQA